MTLRLRKKHLTTRPNTPAVAASSRLHGIETAGAFVLNILAIVTLTNSVSTGLCPFTLASAAQADEQTTATTTHPAASRPEWTQRPHWQVTSERRLNRHTAPTVQLASTQKQLHWRNPERHSQRLDIGQSRTAADTFTARTNTAPQPLGNLAQPEPGGYVPGPPRSLFDDAPTSIEITARRLKDPFHDPFHEQPLGVSAVSHDDVFVPANEAVFAEGDVLGPVSEAVFSRDKVFADKVFADKVFADGERSSEAERDVFQEAEDGGFRRVNQHVFTQPNGRTDIELPRDESEPQRLAQSSDLMDKGPDLQRYRLRQEDRDLSRPMWQLDGNAAQAEESARQPSLDDLELGESDVEAEIEDRSSSTDTDLEDLLKSGTDPFRDDPTYPSQDQETDGGRPEDLIPQQDRTELDSAAEQEPNLFPNLDGGERAEQQMLDDLMQDERLPDDGSTDEQLEDETRDGAPGLDLGFEGAGADEPTARETQEGEFPCTQIYNNRNCCEEEALCERVRRIVREYTLDKISLDIAPPFAPGEEDPAIAEKKRLRQLAKSGSRVWTDRQGNTLVTGQFFDLSNGNAIILRDDGTKVAIRLRVLSQDAMCFVNSWWQLPAECRLSAEDYQLRDWTATTFTWKASALCHKPLYFEDAQLERYGHSAGPIKQPLLSGAHFFANVVLLPYNMGLHPPNECRYALGYYRPGSCAPWLLPAFPLSIEGAAMQTIAVTGLIGILP